MLRLLIRLLQAIFPPSQPPDHIDIGSHADISRNEIQFPEEF